MNAIDFFIIYTACGAPCGVYFFLQNRKRLSAKLLWLKSFLTVFVWIPYVFVLLNDFATKTVIRRHFAAKRLLDSRLTEIQKQFRQLQQKSQNKISVFELREVLERYAGLTEAFHFQNDVPNTCEMEFFRIALRQNTELGANCLHRRNQKRLAQHQIQAREDFLRTLTRLKISIADEEKLRALAIEFVQILGDDEALLALTGIFSEDSQNPMDFHVKLKGTNLWKTGKPILHQPPTERVPIDLQILAKAATKTRVLKD